MNKHRKQKKKTKTEKERTSTERNKLVSGFSFGMLINVAYSLYDTSPCGLYSKYSIKHKNGVPLTY